MGISVFVVHRQASAKTEARKKKAKAGCMLAICAGALFQLLCSNLDEAGAAFYTVENGWWIYA